MPYPIPINIDTALQNLKLSDVVSSRPVLLRNNRVASRLPDPPLAIFPTTIFPQLYGADERSRVQGHKRKLKMQRLPENWEWARSGRTFGNFGEFEYHGQAPPSSRQPWCTDVFANEQVSVFAQPPAQRDCGHIDVPVQPGPLKAVVVFVRAALSPVGANVVNLVGALLSTLWFLVTWLVVVPALGIYRILRFAGLELFLVFLVTDYIVGLLPGFEGPVVSDGKVGGDGGGEDGWTIFIKSGVSMGGTGPVLSD